ncbi:class I SAM-dependent methyltransferase [Desulfonatronum parangueonense]
MTNNPKDWRSHANINFEQRSLKAEKIIRILEARQPLEGARVLDIGTGSGVIAACIAERVGPRGDVVGLDVQDQRVVKEGFTFIQVADSRLPMTDQSFDVVLSNHVIEHVGGPTAQGQHLSEIYRVLRNQGVAYLTAPNRWAIMEPHYRLPFLSWLPHQLAGVYLKAFHKGKVYDCYPPGPAQLCLLLQKAGFSRETVAGQAVRILYELEGGKGLRRVAASMPTWFIDYFAFLSPSFAFLIRKS